MKKQYLKEDLTIFWEPEKCIHSTICWKSKTGLSAVFNPKERPWIKPENSEKETIMQQIDQCPSGALSYQLKRLDKSEGGTTKVTFMKNGPIIMKGRLELKLSDGREEKKEAVVALCRCGGSANKPYCDGTHSKIGFEG